MISTDPAQLCFKSDLFLVDPKEAEETNPFCYGRSLAKWVAARFRELGYEPELIPEDWGWCVMLRSNPFSIWIGCSNFYLDFFGEMSGEDEDSFVPDGAKLTWTCFVGTDVPIWTTFFWKRFFKMASTKRDVASVKEKLEAVLKAESRIEFVQHP